MKGISYCVIRRRLEPLDRSTANLEVIGLHDFRCFLHVASLSLTHLLFATCYCIVLAHFYCKVCF